MNVGKLLSRRVTCNGHGQNSSYFLGWQEYERNPYHHITNPSGMIQMGLAENQLSFDLLETWLASHPEATDFTNGGGSLSGLFRQLALFQDYHGLPAFKVAVAEFMSELRGNKVRFDPKKVVLTAGATCANEALVFCLANPGEAFLIPTPYYPGFDRDLKWRTGAQIIPIHCSSANGFRLSKAALEDAYRRAAKQKVPVKGVLISNPSNPLGTTMTPLELSTLADFIEAKNLHLICDEIYSGTNFISTPSDFISIQQVVAQRPHLSHQVHIVYSLSKDLGLPGFRVGAIYSENDLVVQAATKMSSFGLVSSQTQHLLAKMLGDKHFTRNYIVENKARLKERHYKLVTGLADIGIECLESNSGLFCWVDMRHLLRRNSFESEMELWKKIVYGVGLNISPGSSCHCAEPGWFRVCFANMTEATLHLAMQRLRDFVQNGAVMRRQRRSRLRPAAAIACWARRLLTPSEKRVEDLSR